MMTVVATKRYRSRRARQAFHSAVIFGNGLEHDAPPEISVDLDVPFVPPRVG